MNSQSALGGYSTTMVFVEELSRHMKINKICDVATDCFPSQIYVDGEVVEVSDIKNQIICIE